MIVTSKIREDERLKDQQNLMDDERVIQLFSPPLSLVWVYSEIVICHWWCVCLSVLQQPGPNRA